MTERLAVAGLSARMMVESAQRGGFDAIALDLFGDLDTRRAAMSWTPIGQASTLRIDPDATLAALSRLAQIPRLVGWVAGSGFEALPQTLSNGAKLVRLVGNAADTVASIRTPRTFFDALDRLGIEHPRVSFHRPTGSRWLWKDAHSSGGIHVRRVDRLPLGAHRSSAGGYFQRERDGVPMSVLFVAAQTDVRIVAVSELLVEARADHPFIYRGAIGPIDVSGRVTSTLTDIVRALTVHWALVGLNCVDFLLDGEDIRVLELNPRPSASMTLYDHAVSGGLMRAHVDACLRRTLPERTSVGPTRVRGVATVYADRALRMPATARDAWVDAGWCHDIPAADATFGAGDPVCTVSAMADTPDAVRESLTNRSARVQTSLAPTAALTHAMQR